MACILCKGSIRAGFLGALGLALVGLASISGQDSPGSKVASQRAEAGLPPDSKRGPGMKGPATDFLKLPVPRTFDLTHVEPEHFAVALGKDPQRIFEFVRDHVAFEVYTGCLRGPRGTLLAMAGNSLDRATLLAALLEKSGQQVRFIRGTLPEADAKELVTSMWAKRPRPVAPSESKPSPAVKAALDTLMACVKRDYNLIRNRVKELDQLPARRPSPSLKELVKEAESHYWVQSFKENKWVDLDPSFADSVPGRTHAKAEKQFARLPEELHHRVTIRLELEEYGILLQGNAEARPSKREILRYTAKAADLSGADLLLTHQPENWQGPAKNLQSALAAINNTGKMKPVLVTGPKKWIAGDSFRQQPSTGSGVFAGLSGEGTRNPMPIATAEWMVLEFVYPDGHQEKVVRQIFDLVGMARRADAKNLAAAEVRDRTKGKEALDLSRAVFALFFSTGSIDATNLSMVDKPAAPERTNPSRTRRALKVINITLAALADKLLTSLGKDDRTIFHFYPNSPRVHIVDLRWARGERQLTIDLRRDHALAVARSDPAETFNARVFHGVVNGTLERVLGEYLTAEMSGKKFTPVFSTSSLFDQAFSEGIPIQVFWGDGKRLPKDLSQDSKARLRETLTNGSLVVAPQRGIRRGTELRSAWWQIDPRSGRTTAVTDEGLHSTTCERYVLIGSEVDGEITVVVEDYFEGQVDRTYFQVAADQLEHLLTDLGDIDHILFTGP